MNTTDLAPELLDILPRLIDRFGAAGVKKAVDLLAGAGSVSSQEATADRPVHLAPRHVKEYGWGLFDIATGEKLGDEKGPWWRSKKAARAAAAAHSETPAEPECDHCTDDPLDRGRCTQGAQQQGGV